MLYLLLFLLIPLFAAYIFYVRIKTDHFFKLVLKGCLKIKQPLDFASYFSTHCLQNIVKSLIKNRKIKILFSLSLGRTSSAESFFKNKNNQICFIFLKSLKNYNEGISLLKSLPETSLSWELQIELAELYFLTEHYASAEKILQKIPSKHISRYVQAKKSYYLAHFCLKQGDMLNASSLANKAALLFKKEKAYLEEAKTYLLSGTIYRIAAVEDVSHLMLSQAEKLFCALDYKPGKAEALGNLGMLWTMRENYIDAEKYFLQSLQINLELKRYEAVGLIYNQLALLYLVQKQYLSSLVYIRKAMNVFRKSKHSFGNAFGNILYSYLLYETQNWHNLEKQAQYTLNLYEKINDLSSYLDCFYLKAIACFEQNNLVMAESCLRIVIEKSLHQNCCFHIGNAYNLLGLIFLKQNDLARAKSIFLQSASWEQKEERFSAAATDYANIALIETKLGNQKQALKTFETALSYASAFSENELSNFLQKKIDSLKNNLE